MTDTIRKTFTADLSVADGDRCVTASISTIQVDRDGEVLIPQGCDATEFQRSPTVFYNHDYGLPIGRCESIRRTDNHVEAKTRFAKRPDGHEGEWLADTVFALIQQGVVNGFSVGFIPVEGRHPSKSDRTKMGPKVRYVYSKWKLLEYSVAPLPCNQDALVMAVSKGVVSPHTAKQLFPQFDLEPPRTKRRIHMIVPSDTQSTLSLEQRVQRHVLRAKGQLHLN